MVSAAPEARLRGAADAERSSLALAALLGAFVVAWTLYGAIAGASGAIHHDTAEAFIWGREFQLGYYKHPPFWAWIAGAWFSVAPHATWSFGLLSVINAALGLWGSWALIGNFEGGKSRASATFLLLLTPCFTFLAFKFNANSIFLSLWPWTLHFFARSFGTRRLGDAVWFGVFVALALLSKYFAVLLAITCFIAAVAHPARKLYFASWAPYISVVVALVLLAPHIWWLTQTGFMPFHYFDAETGRGLLPIAGHAAGTLAAVVLWHAGVIVLIASCATSPMRTWPTRALDLWRTPPTRMLTILALAPILLTACVAIVFRNKISNNMLMGTVSLLPLLLMRVAAPDARLLKRAAGAAIALSALALAASPLVALASIRFSNEPAFSEPREEAAAFVSQRWRAFTRTPLRFVSGEHHYADALAFYGPDHPHVFIDFSYHEAPWVRPDELARDGIAVICLETDSACVAAGQRLSTPQTQVLHPRFTHAFGGFSRRAVGLTIFLVPPRSAQAGRAGS